MRKLICGRRYLRARTWQQAETIRRRRARRDDGLRGGARATRRARARIDGRERARRRRSRPTSRTTSPRRCTRDARSGCGSAPRSAPIAFAYQFDDDVREHFETVTVAPGTSPDTEDGRDAAPAVLALGGTWIAAVARPTRTTGGARPAPCSRPRRSAARRLTRSRSSRGASGRTRPPTRIAWGDDGDAFPSLHTTAAFAIGTVLAESGNDRHRWLRRALGYGLAVGTAYARMDHDAHWLSDTVAGAGLGIATARFVMKQRDARRRAAARAFELVADRRRCRRRLHGRLATPLTSQRSTTS